MVHARQSQPHRPDKSRNLQRRLYLAAKRSRNRRFHALFDRIVRPDVLWRAWEEVRANRGRAGVDGVRIEDVERDGVDAYLAGLAADLKAQGYRPQPVLRVEIPKPDGRMRPLGIPTVRDRLVQQACKIVIEPLFEANFQPCSFGDRPKRSAGQAVQAVREALVRRWWVVDADIEGFFDTVDHEILRRLVRRRISDRRVLHLIDQWLRAGVLIDGRRHETRRGVPKRPSRRTGRLVPYMWPSQKAMRTVREKIRQQPRAPACGWTSASWWGRSTGPSWAGGPTSCLGTPRRSWPISIGTCGFGCGGS